MMIWSLVLRAVFIGIISYGMTGKILEPPFSKSSLVPRMDKNL